MAPATCAMCQLGQEAVDALGPMLTFLITKGNKRQETAAVHTLCVAWSPRVHFVGNEEVSRKSREQVLHVRLPSTHEGVHCVCGKR